MKQKQKQIKTKQKQNKTKNTKKNTKNKNKNRKTKQNTTKTKPQNNKSVINVFHYITDSVCLLSSPGETVSSFFHFRLMKIIMAAHKTTTNPTQTNTMPTRYDVESVKSGLV